MVTTNNGAPAAATTISTTDVAGPSPVVAPVAGPPNPGAVPDSQGASEHDPSGGVGVEGEEPVWEASYSMRNFIGRGLSRLVLTVAWLALAYYVWGRGHEGLANPTWLAAIVVGALWLHLFVRILMARFSHYYELTNRRLFVSTGIIHRRRDMLELMRIKEAYTRQQSLLDRWLDLGTVVVVPNDNAIPQFLLPGVDHPQQVMDLIWHHARAERDERSVKVDSV